MRCSINTGTVRNPFTKRSSEAVCSISSERWPRLVWARWSFISPLAPSEGGAARLSSAGGRGARPAIAAPMRWTANHAREAGPAGRGGSWSMPARVPPFLPAVVAQVFFRTIFLRDGLAWGTLLLPLLNHDTAGDGTALRDITRAIRRICLLQEVDRQDEASGLETELLAPLVNAYRDAHGPNALPDERLRDIVRTEQERVGDAAALNELLAPLLAEFLDRPAGAVRSGRTLATETSPLSTGRRPAATPEIADLLDGMLAQEKPRPSAPPRRPRA